MTGKTKDTSLSGRAFTAVSWQYVAVFGRSVLQIASMAVLARVLSPADFGSVAMAIVVIHLTTAINRAVRPTVVQRPNLKEQDTRTIQTFSLVAAVLLAPTLWLTAPSLSAVFRNDSMELTLRALSPLPCVMYAGAVAEGLLVRRLEFKRLMVAELASYAVYCVVAIVFASIRPDIWALLGATLAQFAARSAILVGFERRALALGFSYRAFKDQARYMIGFSIGRVFNVTATQVDYLIVARTLGATALGFYERAYHFMILPSTLIGRVLQTVGFPVLAQLQGDPDRFRKAYLRIHMLAALASAPIAALMVILAPELVRLQFGPGWEQIVAPLRALAAGVWLSNAYRISEAAAHASGYAMARASAQAVYAGFVVMGAWIGSRWGIYGVSVAVLIAVTTNYMLIATLCLWITRTPSWQFAATQAPGVIVAVVAFSVAAPVASWCRANEVGSVFTLLATGLSGFCIWAALVFLTPPEWTPHGAWLRNQFRQRLRLWRVEAPDTDSCDDPESDIVSTRHKRER